MSRIILLPLLIACGPIPPRDPVDSSTTGSQDFTTSLPTTSGFEDSTSTSESSSEGGSSSTGELNFCTLCDIFGDCIENHQCVLDEIKGVHICVPQCERGDKCESIEALCNEDLDGVGFSCQPKDGLMLCLPDRIQ